MRRGGWKGNEKMKFAIPNEVRLVSLRNIPAKTGGEMTIATIANVVTYETLETRLELATGQTMASIVVGQNYKAFVEYNGKYGSVTLTPPAAPAK
jgi:hypothetical protein